MRSEDLQRADEIERRLLSQSRVPVRDLISMCGSYATYATVMDRVKFNLTADGYSIRIRFDHALRCLVFETRSELVSG